MRRKKMTVCGIVFLLCFSAFQSGAGFAAEKHPVVRLETSMGNISLELYEDKSPITVGNFLSYVISGFYDATIFHRVIKAFVIQGGGYSKDFEKKETLDPIRNEAANGLSNDAYTIAMARTTAPHSATSQFFINAVDNHSLNYSEQNAGYAVFGKVIRGTDVVDAINSVATENERPLEPVIIRKALIEDPGSLLDTAPKLRFPLVISGNSWETHIGIINSDDANGLSGALQVFDQKGKAVSDVNIIRLMPNGRKEIRIGEMSPDTVGYAVFSAAADTFAGYSEIRLGDEYGLTAPAAKENRAENLHIPLLLSADDWWTVISLLNTGDSARTVEIIFNDGSVKTRSIAAGAIDLFLVRDLFDGKTPGGIFSASIRHTEDIIAFQAMGSAGTRYLTGELLKGETSAKQYFPRIFNDQNGFTAIMAYNPGDSDCAFKIKPYTDDGESLGTDTVSVKSGNGYLGAFSPENMPEKTAWFEVESQNPLGGESCPAAGSGFFGTFDGELLAGYSAAGMVAKSGVFPKLEKGGYSAAVFLNPGYTRARIHITAYNDAGSTVDTAELVLDSRSSTWKLMEEFFDKDISEATHVRYVCEKDIAAFQATLSGNSMMLDAMTGGSR